jgi:hypothetical protein
MQKMNKLASAIVALALSCSVNAAEDLLPSEFTILVNHALVAEPGVDRGSVIAPLIERVRTEGLSDMERFMKGEVYFLSLDPEKSRDEYWEFRNHDGDLGRVAWQRLMVIRINAFQMLEQVLERDIPNYSERFGIQANDRYGITFPVQRTAELLLERGHADQALDLIVSHVRQHDRFDAPYSAYALPGQFFALASKNNRAEEYRELNEWVLAGLAATIKQRLENPVNDGPQASGIPGEIFFSVFADRKLDSYQWTGEFLKLRHRIVEGVATARARPGQ